MKYRLLLAFPVAFVCVLFALACVTDTQEGFRQLLRAEIETVKALALIGALVAASAFDRGDYMRRAWLLNAVCYLLLLARDATFLAAPLAWPFPNARHYAEAAFVLLANAAAVVSVWLFGVAWRVAGLSLPGSKTTRRVGIAAALLVALGITGASLALGVRRLAGGDAGAVVALASNLGDVVSLCFLAPVLLTAVALRGGVLRYTWGLLAASMFGWLLYDAATTLGPLLIADERSRRLLIEGFRALACTCSFSAGVTVRFAVRHIAPA